MMLWGITANSFLIETVVYERKRMCASLSTRWVENFAYILDKDLHSIKIYSSSTITYDVQMVRRSLATLHA